MIEKQILICPFCKKQLEINNNIICYNCNLAVSGKLLNEIKKNSAVKKNTGKK